jgi:hypothetical protein
MVDLSVANTQAAEEASVAARDIEGVVEAIAAGARELDRISGDLHEATLRFAV